MKVDAKTPPRTFVVRGAGIEATLHDCGRVTLDANEQVTFLTEQGAEYDVARKDWGFYATPSTNGRLKDFCFRSALVRSSSGRFYVMLVEAEKMPAFENYITEDKQTVVCWLDDESHLARIAEAFNVTG